MNCTDRYRQLVRQDTYRRSVHALGLTALLAPYAIHSPRVPQQRRAVPQSTAKYAV